MKVSLRIGSVLALILLLAPAGFADTPGDARAKAKANASAKTFSNESLAKPAGSTPAKPAPLARTAVSAPRPAPRPANAYLEDPAWTPLAATTGTLGLFTVETGDTLPRHGFSFSAYANKFSRMPGSITVLNLGYTAGYGITDWLTLYGVFEPYRHIHIGRAGQLSFNSPLDNPPFPDFTNPTIYRRLTKIPPTSNPGYVEDYPFAGTNDGGVGEVTLGLKLGILSERKGNPVSFSVRNDFIFPTRSTLPDLLNNTTQSGQFNYNLGLALSKNWGRWITSTFNWDWRFTRDPRANGVRAMNQADQMRVGAGFIILPQSRIQILQEYTGLVFFGTHTPNTTFDRRNPVDGVWGVRIYPVNWVALDVGYRNMLNLRNHEDRHGFVVKLATTYWPEKPKPINRNPTASCSADPGSVYAGSGDVITVRATASDPDGNPLTFDWTATGGSVSGTAAEARWSSAGTAPGTYTITARVSDGAGGTASCAVDVRVEPKPNAAPTMSCSADRTSVLVGERVRITARASDPDNDSLNYSWRSNGGQVLGTGAAVQLDTSGLAAGRYTVTGRVDDGRGAAADCSTSIDVQAPPPPPQASKLNECFFKGVGSARIDNVCKRILDDVALRIQSDARATIVIVGYADPKERRSATLAQQRGDNAQKYLTSKGVDAARINVRAAGGQAGAGAQNRRLDVIWVPQGATY